MAEDAAGTALAPLDSGRGRSARRRPLSAAAMQYARQSLSAATRRANKIFFFFLKKKKKKKKKKNAPPPRPWSPTTWGNSPANAPTPP